MSKLWNALYSNLKSRWNLLWLPIRLWENIEEHTNRNLCKLEENKDNKKLAQNFETWKKQAKEKINQMKKGKLTENKVYEWIITNK